MRNLHTELCEGDNVIVHGQDKVYHGTVLSVVHNHEIALVDIKDADPFQSGETLPSWLVWCAFERLRRDDQEVAKA